MDDELDQLIQNRVTNKKYIETMEIDIGNLLDSLYDPIFIKINDYKVE